jgi:hypothetical protein
VRRVDLLRLRHFRGRAVGVAGVDEVLRAPQIPRRLEPLRALLRIVDGGGERFIR